MRLTLRTLLAYLDDVLSPDATKDIGQKIQDSPMAQLLVSRIREVMRRRRLKAPDVFGPEIGIDPNIISQYLDNTLAADQYADVERVLLASDELLAETASCHQILALVLGDGTEIPQAIRERLYALGPVDESSKLAVAMDTDLELKSRTPMSISTRNSPGKTETVSSKAADSIVQSPITVPEYLKPAPFWRRSFPSAVVVILMIACVALLIPAVQNGLQQAYDELQRKVARNSPPVNSKEMPPADNRRARTEEATSIEVAANPADVTTDGDQMEAADSGGKSQPVVDVKPRNEDWEEDLPTPDLQTNGTKAAATVSNAVPPAPSPPKDDPNVDPLVNPNQAPLPNEILADLRIPYRSNEGILIRRNFAKQHWYVVPHQSDLQPDDRIANLEPFDGRLEFEKSGVGATLVGECVLELLRPTGAALQGLNIGRGRVVLQPRSQNLDERGTIGIAIGEDLWKLQLMTPNTICAVEVRIEPPFQLEKLSDVRWYQAALYVISGSVQWTNIAGKTFDVTESNGLEIVPERIAAPDAAPVPLPAIPEWCDASKRRAQQQLLKKIQSNFEKTFDVDQPVDESMITVVSNEKNPKIASLAAHCLAAMDNYAAMVQILATCDHEEARFAARDGIRQWLPINPANGPKLKQALQAHYQDSDAEDVYQLLWGFSRDDVKQSLARSLQFTTWMLSPKREIRELAEYWVKQLTGRPLEYKALSPQANREAQVKQLDLKIRRNNGLIGNQ